MTTTPALPYLLRLGACPPALDWIATQRIASLEDAWAQCPRGDWMLWLCRHRQVEHKTLVRIALDCARLVEFPEVRCCNDTLERWLEGQATLEEVRAAASRAAAWAAASRAAAEALWAAETAAEALWAAETAETVAQAASVAPWAAEAAAEVATHQQCADIVRRHLPTLPPER